MSMSDEHVYVGDEGDDDEGGQATEEGATDAAGGTEGGDKESCHEEGAGACPPCRV